MLYRGTTVTYGRCVAVVTVTGMATELGRIASLLQTTMPVARVVNEPPLLLLLAAGALCNDATPRKEEGEEHSCRALGDPTEVALLVAACEWGIRKAVLSYLRALAGPGVY